MPILVIPSFRLISSRDVQFWNAYVPIDVTVFGIVTFVSPVSPAHALFAIAVVPSANVTSVIPVFTKVLLPIDVSDAGSVTAVRPVHPLNTFVPSDVKVEGSVIDVNAVHLLNA